MIRDPAGVEEFPDGFISEIFTMREYEAGEPAQREFQPWHRPRKQFVRREQWIEQTRRVLAGRRNGDPLVYLGLPGVDLIDLRYFYEEVCIPQGRELRFLGFNSEAATVPSAEIELNVSLDEITKLRHVDPESSVIRDDIRKLAQANSVAWERAKALAPFDVVNLDFCDGLASGDPDSQPSIYDAISALLSLQARNPNSWVLLITTRVGREHFHDVALDKLLEKFNSNVTNCEEFAIQCCELLGVEKPSEIDHSTCSEKEFLLLMLVAVCKWLLALGQRESANRVSLASCLAYRVNPASPCEDLVSFSLVFRPLFQPAKNSLELSQASGIDECSEASRIARRAKKLLDVDAVLSTEADIREELTTEMERLLLAARYKFGYRKWLLEE